jgi:hypothetical protein
MPVSRDDCGGRCQGNAQLAGRARAVHERLMETLRRMVLAFYHNVLPLVNVPYSQPHMLVEDALREFGSDDIQQRETGECQDQVYRQRYETQELVER